MFTTGMFRICAAALTLWLASGGLALSESRAFSFDGHTLTEYRSGGGSDDCFVEFTHQSKAAREMFVIRALGSVDFKAQVSRLLADIRTHHPDAKPRVFERAQGSDVMVLYLLTPDRGDPSLVLWRVAKSGTGMIAVTYELDFDLDDEESKAKVTDHTAELAFSKLDPAVLKALLPAAQPGKS